jgi:hypothetical protein
MKRQILNCFLNEIETKIIEEARSRLQPYVPSYILTNEAESIAREFAIKLLSAFLKEECE